MIGDFAHADFVAEVADGHARHAQRTQLLPKHDALGFQRGDVQSARVVVNADVVCPRRFDGDDGGGHALREQRIGLVPGAADVLGEALNAHAHGQLEHVGDILINVQPDDGGTVLDGLHAVFRTDDDRLCAEGQHERAGEQHGGNHAVHLRHFMRKKNESGQDIDQIAGLNRVHERLRGVHGQRFARRLAAPGVEDAADAVAPRIKIHQGVEVFPHISFFQFIAVHAAPPCCVMQR